MPDVEPGRKIHAPQRGNQTGFWFFRMALRLTGLRGAYGLLYIVCTHYLLFDRTAVRAAMAYVSHRFPSRGWGFRMLAVYRLFVSQGKNLIDRYALTTGAVRFETVFEDRASLEPLLARPGGFLLLMSHMGNWQFILATIGTLHRRVQLVMRPEDNPAVHRALAIDGQTDQIGVISPESFMGGTVEITRALARGDIVCMMGDRSYGFVSETVQFLGAAARLPCGPFAVAAATDSPILVLFPAKLGTRQYRIEVAGIIHPKYQPGQKRDIQLRGWLQQYAQWLEHYVERHPFQCFLFHDIWRETDSIVHRSNAGRSPLSNITKNAS